MNWFKSIVYRETWFTSKFEIQAIFFIESDIFLNKQILMGNAWIEPPVQYLMRIRQLFSISVIARRIRRCVLKWLYTHTANLIFIHCCCCSLQISIDTCFQNYLYGFHNCAHLSCHRKMCVCVFPHLIYIYSFVSLTMAEPQSRLNATIQFFGQFEMHKCH